MMNKKMVLRMIRLAYPNADHILVDIEGNHLHARCTKDAAKDVSKALDAESEYLPMLSSEFGINNIRKINIDLISNTVEFVGDITKKV